MIDVQATTETAANRPQARRFIGSPLVSLARDVARASLNGTYNAALPVYNFRSFITPPEVALLSDRSGDKYLNGMALPAASSGEVPVVFTQAAGLMPNQQTGDPGYWSRIGMLTTDQRAIEINSDEAISGSSRYPHTDVIHLLNQSGFRAAGEYAMTTLPDDRKRQQLLEMGFQTIQEYDSAQMNDKAAFREAAAQYGISMCEGFVMGNADYYSLAETIRSWPHGAWIKLNRGSGGDYVQRIALAGIDPQSPHALNLIQARIERAMANLRSSVYDAFSEPQDRVREDFATPEAALRYWPAESVLPYSAQVVVEADARNYGQVNVNSSNVMRIHSDGRYEIPAWFAQRTGPSGDFRGSEPYVPDAEELALLEQQMQGIAQYCVDNKLFGVVGVDFMVVENNGQREIKIVELNGRAPISAASKTIADKYLLAHNIAEAHWVNLNIWLNEEYGDMSDADAFVRALQCQDDSGQMLDLAGANAEHGDINGGIVILQALRAEWDMRGGQRVLRRPSNAAKVLIMARDRAEVSRVMRNLEQQGKIRFSAQRD